MMRGLFAVDEIFPNADPVLSMRLGLEKLGVLVTLKNSMRANRRPARSSPNVRCSARSASRWPGPRTMPTPLLPKSVSPGPLPNGASGALMNPAGLRYPFSTRENVDPDVATGLPDSCARCSNGYVPYTCPALLSTIVIGVPDCATRMPETSQ